MTKKVRKRKNTQGSTGKQETNWLIIGSIGGLGVLFLVAMMYLALKSPEAPKAATQSLLGRYCEDNPDACVSMGDDDAPVTIVEVSDYGCPHCRNFNMTTAPLIKEEYVDTGIVRYVSVPFSFGPATLVGATAAMCANEQDSYFEYQTALFAATKSGSDLSPEHVTETAVNMGLDKAAFEECLNSGKYSGIVNRNRSAAQESGLTATPSFFINGRLVEGNNPFESFATFIAEAQQEN